MDAERTDRVWRAVQASPRPPRRAMWSAALVAAAAAAMVLVALVSRDERGSIRRADGSQLAVMRASESNERVELEEGSAIELADHSVLAPIANEGNALELELSGRARFSVTPGGPRRWTIHGALGEVVVLGTVFTVESSRDRLEVVVERGHVNVRSPLAVNGEVSLEAGMKIVLEPARPELTREDSLVDERFGETAIAPVSAPAVPARGRATPTPSRDQGQWLALAERGQAQEAYEAARSEAEQVVRAGSARERMVLADVARLSRHPRDAIAPLEAIVNEHAGSPEAPLAALTLARLLMDVLHEDDAAASLLARDLPRLRGSALDGELAARRCVTLVPSDRVGAEACLEELRQRNVPGRWLTTVERALEP
jgi:transmembrane sensor